MHIQIHQELWFFLKIFLLLNSFLEVKTVCFVWLFFPLCQKAYAFCCCVLTGDALHSLRANLIDPNNVLQSWDPTLVNPCTWFHVTCNNENSVIRV